MRDDGSAFHGSRSGCRPASWRARRSAQLPTTVDASSPAGGGWRESDARPIEHFGVAPPLHERHAMTNQPDTLEACDLDAVTGGQNTTQGQLGLQIPMRGGNVNVGVSGSQAQSDYGKCVSTVAAIPGIKPADIREACGLPPGTAPR